MFKIAAIFLAAGTLTAAAQTISLVVTRVGTTPLRVSGLHSPVQQTPFLNMPAIMSLTLAPAAVKPIAATQLMPAVKIMAAASVKDSSLSVIQSGDANVDKGPALKSLFDNAPPAPIERVWTKDELQSIIDWSLILIVKKYGIVRAKVTFGIDNPDLPILTLFVDRSINLNAVEKALKKDKLIAIHRFYPNQIRYEYETTESGR